MFWASKAAPPTPKAPSTLWKLSWALGWQFPALQPCPFPWLSLASVYCTSTFLILLPLEWDRRWEHQGAEITAPHPRPAQHPRFKHLPLSQAPEAAPRLNPCVLRGCKQLNPDTGKAQSHATLLSPSFPPVPINATSALVAQPQDPGKG